MLGEFLSKKLLRDKRGDVSLSGSQHFAAGAPRGEHGNTTLPSASSRRVSLPFTQFPACLGGPFDTNSALRRTLVKESRSAPRLIAGLLLTQSPAYPGGPFRHATPALASSSFISRGRRALSFSYLSTLLPSEPSLLAVFFTPLLWRVSSEPS